MERRWLRSPREIFPKQFEYICSSKIVVENLAHGKKNKITCMMIKCWTFPGSYLSLSLPLRSRPMKDISSLFLALNLNQVTEKSNGVQ